MVRKIKLNQNMAFSFLPLGIIPQLANKATDGIKEEVKKTFSIADFLGFKAKVVEIANSLHEKALLTPDPSDDKIDYLKYLYDAGGQGAITRFAPDWFKDIIVYLLSTFSMAAHNGSQWLVEGIYNIVSSIVVWTPEFLFGNSWFPETISHFTTISIGVVIVFAMFEGLKRICKLSNTPFGHTLKRLPVALLVSGFTPFLFSNGVRWLNKITKIILQIGSKEFGGAGNFEDLFQTSIAFDPLNIVMMIAFAILFAMLCVPMFLFHGRRWFVLMMSGVLTPLAMSAYLFKNTEHYFHKWLDAIKTACTSQLLFAAFVSVLGLIMFGTPNPTTTAGAFSKLLLMLGGVHMMAYPPSFVTRDLTFGKGAKETYDDLKSKYNSVSGGITSAKGIAKKALGLFTKK